MYRHPDAPTPHCDGRPPDGADRWPSQRGAGTGLAQPVGPSLAKWGVLTSVGRPGTLRAANPDTEATEVRGSAERRLRMRSCYADRQRRRTHRRAWTWLRASLTFASDKLPGLIVIENAVACSTGRGGVVPALDHEVWDQRLLSVFHIRLERNC
jgi:hypothetical protein